MLVICDFVDGGIEQSGAVESAELVVRHAVGIVRLPFNWRALTPST
jgi:hypothetical protein